MKEKDGIRYYEEGEKGLKRSWYIVIGALMLLLLIISLILDVIIISNLKSIRIMDYHQVGLSPLINDDIKEMFVDQGNDPDLQGVFSDEQFAQKICDVLKNGCYQSCPQLNSDDAPGSHSYPFIRFTTESHTFAILVSKEKVKISIDGSSKYYYSNIGQELKIIIYDILEEYFPRKTLLI